MEQAKEGTGGKGEPGHLQAESDEGLQRRANNLERLSTAAAAATDRCRADESHSVRHELRG